MERTKQFLFIKSESKYCQCDNCRKRNIFCHCNYCRMPECIRNCCCYSESDSRNSCTNKQLTDMCRTNSESHNHCSCWCNVFLDRTEQFQFITSESDHSGSNCSSRRNIFSYCICQRLYQFSRNSRMCCEHATCSTDCNQ